MKAQEIAALCEVAEARRRKIEAELAALKQREAQMRALLDEMAGQIRDGIRHHSAEMDSMKSLGAHQAWADFARRRRAALNRDLANLIADRLECEDRLRRQIGETDAFDALLTEARQARKKTRAAQAQDEMLRLHMLRNLARDLPV